MNKALEENRRYRVMEKQTAEDIFNKGLMEGMRTAEDLAQAANGIAFMVETVDDEDPNEVPVDFILVNAFHAALKAYNEKAKGA